MKKMNLVVAAGLVALAMGTAQAQAVGGGVVVGASQTTYAGNTAAQGGITVKGQATAATSLAAVSYTHLTLPTKA